MTEQHTNTSVAPQSGIHATVPTSKTTYDFEVLFPFSEQWIPATAMTEDHQPFTTPEAAYEWWFAFAASSDLYRSAQMRRVCSTSRIMGPAVEPVEGWPVYHRAMALIEADRAARTTS